MINAGEKRETRQGKARQRPAEHVDEFKDRVCKHRGGVCLEAVISPGDWKECVTHKCRKVRCSGHGSSTVIGSTWSLGSCNSVSLVL